MSERFIPEEYLQDKPKNKEPEPLPIGLAKALVGGSLGENSQIVHEGEMADIYRVYEKEEQVAEIPKTSFHLDYLKIKTEEDLDNVFDQLRFEYATPNKDNEGYRLISEMHLGIAPSNMFILQHRYVAPEFRGRRGIGTKLLKQAESFLQQVANEKGEDVTIALKTGQESVIKWLEKLGYEVIEDQQILRNELKNHPNRFFRDKVILSESSTADGIEKDLYTFRQGETGRYMENAIRLTFKKVIKASK